MMGRGGRIPRRKFEGRAAGQAENEGNTQKRLYFGAGEPKHGISIYLIIFYLANQDGPLYN